MSLKKIIVWFMVALSLFVVLLFPAAVVIKQLPVNNLKYENVQGTIWNGSLDAAQIGKVAVQSVEWQFEPLELLTGKFAYSLKFGQARSKSTISGRGIIAAGISGITARDVTVRLPANNLKTMSPVPVGDIAGRIVLEVNSYTYAKPLCKELHGQVSWLQAGVDINGNIDFGMINADLVCENKELIAKFDGNNSLGLAGAANVKSAKSFSFDGFVKPDQSLPAVIHQSIGFFAKQDNQGRYIIKL